MTDIITLTGLVATVPYVVSQDDKVPFTSFRLASNQRYFDRRTSQWVAGETNWYTVTAFRALAVNAAASIHKGDRVIVTGKLKVRRWETGEKSGLAVDVEAEGIGHDLVWGTARYERTLQREQPSTPSSMGASEAGESDENYSSSSSSAPHNPPDGSVWSATTPGSSNGDLVAASADSEPPF